MAQEPEYIYPPNSLKSKIAADASAVDIIALQDAEAAIGEMAEEYLGWVKDDIANLQGAYEKAAANPSTADEAREEMYGFAHDIKGQG
ncbi:MAG: phosphorelay protein, partial [Rhodospirillaceae bacterium]|nr:phosphorelay protein [Rhodospirillaceae bacterium]